MSAPLASHRTNGAAVVSEFSTKGTVDPSAPWLAVVAEKVRGLHFGTVQITIHDAKVVQIERIERTRFEVPK